MMMNCKVCSGRIFVDRVLTGEDHVELACIMCGRRWIFHNAESKGRFPQWLMKVEKQYLKIVQG